MKPEDNSPAEIVRTHDILIVAVVTTILIGYHLGLLTFEISVLGLLGFYLITYGVLLR